MPFHLIGGTTPPNAGSFTVFNGELIVGGYFTYAGGAPAN